MIFATNANNMRIHFHFLSHYSADKGLATKRQAVHLNDLQHYTHLITSLHCQGDVMGGTKPCPRPFE